MVLEVILVFLGVVLVVLEANIEHRPYKVLIMLLLGHYREALYNAPFVAL